MSTFEIQGMSRLEEVAKRLNEESNRLGSLISQIEGSLKKLNLGVEAWATYADNSLGYCRIDNTWGLATKVEGEKRLLSRAPRLHRCLSLSLLPELIDALNSATLAMIERTEKSAQTAKEMVEAIEREAEHS